MGNCSSCSAPIEAKRYESKDGCGLCPMCENHAKQQAAAAGAPPPPPSKRWEDLFLDEMVTLVVDEQGHKITHEMRDDMSHMLGSNKRARRDECSTAHQRRPDILYLVRNKNARIIAAISVEVDEHSHNGRPLECETGKVDETFQSILKLAQEEGKSRLAHFRKGKIKTPYVLFLRVNPNACNAPGGTIRLKTRIAVTAAKVTEFLRTPHAEFARRASKGLCDAPHVACLYYHTVEGGASLAHFEKTAVSTWEHKGETKTNRAFFYEGNSCPRA
jgi:uncharacterized Zn finger protein (UPF0148 family)